MNEQLLMQPGDTFVATECGCAFTVTSGPNDTSMVKQAPQCCCGHPMVKQNAPDNAVMSTDSDAVDPVGA